MYARCRLRRCRERCRRLPWKDASRIIAGQRLTIPAGAKIYLSQWVLHRNPRYFPDPERFDPERFTDNAIRSRPRFTYIPFGAGRRLCIGEDFAWMQAVLALAWIMRRFRLRLEPGQTITPEPNVTLRPRDGIRMRIAPR